MKLFLVCEIQVDLRIGIEARGQVLYLTGSQVTLQLAAIQHLMTLCTLSHSPPITPHTPLPTLVQE